MHLNSLFLAGLLLPGICYGLELAPTSLVHTPQGHLTFLLTLEPRSLSQVS